MQKCPSAEVETGPCESSGIGHLVMQALVQISCHFTTPPHPYPSLNKPPALSLPPPLPNRSPCSCLGWDRGHTAVLGLTVVGIAAVLVLVLVLVLVKLELVIAETKSMCGADVVDVKESIGMVGWRKVRVGVRRMRKSQRYSRMPWRSK